MHEAFSRQHHQVEKIPDNSQEANNRQYYSIGQFSQILCACIVECLQITDGEQVMVVCDCIHVVNTFLLRIELS